MTKRGALVAVLLLAGCSSSGKNAATSESPMLVSGAVVLSGDISVRNTNPAGSPCWTFGNTPLFPSPSRWDAIKQGAQVVVADASGRTVGVGRLGPGSTTRFGTAANRPPCRFTFTVENIPASSSFYRVSVGGHSQQFTRTEMSHGPVLRFP